MNLKLIGAICVILSCGGCGGIMAYHHNIKIQLIRSLIGALDYMSCELQYRYTQLPQLCRQVAGRCQKTMQHVFLLLSEELDAQITPNVKLCMDSVLEKCSDLPVELKKHLKELGTDLGNFDLPGQLKGLERVRCSCCETLEQLLNNKANRLRSYQTLGLCAGAAIAILFV